MSRRNDDDWPEKTVMPTTNPETNEELRREIGECLNIYPDELQYYLPNNVGTRHINALEKLINQHVAKEVKAARIDELEKLKGSEYWNEIDGGSRYIRGFTEEVEARITELQKEETDNE